MVELLSAFAQKFHHIKKARRLSGIDVDGSRRFAVIPQIRQYNHPAIRNAVDFQRRAWPKLYAQLKCSQKKMVTEPSRRGYEKWMEPASVDHESAICPVCGLSVSKILNLLKGHGRHRLLVKLHLAITACSAKSDFAKYNFNLHDSRCIEHTQITGDRRAMKSELCSAARVLYSLRRLCDRIYADHRQG